jgi:hypothetical protein
VLEHALMVIHADGDVFLVGQDAFNMVGIGAPASKQFKAANGSAKL